MKEILLVLVEALVHQKKNLLLILVKQTQSFAWVYIIMLIIVIWFLMEKKYLSLNPKIKILTFQHNFVWEVLLMYLVLLTLEKYLVNGNMYDFSVDYNSIDKSDILNTHKYLMTKNNVK